MGTNNTVIDMKMHWIPKFVLLCLVSVGQGNPAPQYSGATGDLSDGTLDTIKDIFGAGLGDGSDSYSGGAETGKLDDGTNGGIGAVVQIVKNEDGYVAPDDYHTNEKQTQTTNNVDNVFEKCSPVKITDGTGSGTGEFDGGAKGAGT